MDEVLSTQTQVFAPGALKKVDRTLTILFVAKKTDADIGSGYGTKDRDSSSRSAKTSPQTFGTKLEN